MFFYGEKADDKKKDKKVINNLPNILVNENINLNSINVSEGCDIDEVEVELKEDTATNADLQNVFNHIVSCDSNYLFNSYMNEKLLQINTLNIFDHISKDLPIINGQIKHKNVTRQFKVCIDTNASGNFITPQLCNDLLLSQTYHKPIRIRLGDGSRTQSSRSVSLKQLFLYRPDDIKEQIQLKDRSEEVQDIINNILPPTDEPYDRARTDADALAAQARALKSHRQLHRSQKQERIKIGAPDKKIVSGPLTINAVILNGLDYSGYDLIIGIKDVRRLDLTKVFRSLFLPEDQSDEESVGVSAPANAPSGHQLTDPTSDALPIFNVMNTKQNENLNTIVKNSSLPIATSYTTERGKSDPPIGITKHKSNYLDPIHQDDDYLDQMVETHPWQEYFTKTQLTQQIPINVSQSSQNIFGEEVLSLTEILQEIHLQGPAAGQVYLTKSIETNKDCFSKTTRKNPAKIPACQLEVDEQKWARQNCSRYPRLRSKAKEIAVKKFITKALADGIIRPSNAAAYSQILLTPKKDGEWRFCVDYRALNNITQGKKWPIPNIKDLINRIGDRMTDGSAKVFAVLDFTNGYYQCEVDELSKKFTAFITSMGLYEWNRLPMGPKGSPSHFQMHMLNTVFKELIGNIMELYIDDIIIWANSYQELAQRLDQVFAKMREFNLTVVPKKCTFGATKVEYVGHQLDASTDLPSVSFSQKKLDKVDEFDLPETHKALKSFLGLASYFRNHIKDYTSSTHTLQSMVTNYKPRKRLQWSKQQEDSFTQLKNKIINCEKLYFMSTDKPIYIQTDASDYGIGAYLFQRWREPDGSWVERPISFISKSLDKVQRRWSTIEKEAYAIIFAITKWEHYLTGNKFILQTDHRNLTFLNTDLRPKVQRWKIFIQEFDFDIEHIAGPNNIVADALSRHVENKLDNHEKTHEYLYAQLASLEIPTMPIQDYIKTIRDDNDIGENEDIPLIPRDVLDYYDYKVHHIPQDKYKLISACHQTPRPNAPQRVGLLGHGGIEITLRKVHQYLEANPQLQPHDGWPQMRQDVTSFVRQCPCCQKMKLLKRPIQTRPFKTGSYGLWDQVAMDSIGPLPESSNGNKYILTLIDTFSRTVELIALPDLTAEKAAEALIGFIGRYGAPCSFLTDNATQFVNQTVEQLMQLINIEHTYTHPYSSEENGIVERCNREVQRHLRDIIFDSRIIESWDTYLPLVQRILNSAHHTSIGTSPMELVYGRNLDPHRGIITPYVRPDSNLSEWLIKQIYSQQNAITVALEKQHEADMHHIKTSYYQNPASIRKKYGISELNFPINSYVLVVPEISPKSKLHTVLLGPLRVVSKQTRGNKPSIYTCEDLITSKLQDFNVKLLRPFHYDSERVNPIQIALSDRQEFVIERVISHNFNPIDSKKPSDLYFTIKWIGENEPTVDEPWSNVNGIGVVHDYLIANKMRTYIPAKYKSKA